MKVSGEWRATIGNHGGKSFLADSFHRFPLQVVPYEGDNNELLLYLMSGSPGILNGDRQEIECRLTKGTHLFLTDTSATELHPSLIDEESKQIQTFFLEENSILEYLPEPIIPFKGSNYNGKISIHMNKGSQAFIGEIVTAGRVGSNELFQYHCFQSSFEVFVENQLQAWDSIRLDPKTNLRQDGILKDYTHMGALWILSENISQNHLDYIQNIILTELENLNCYGGASLLQENGIMIRLLGYSSEALQSMMKICWDYFRGALLHLQPLEVLK